jgi:hypothetical protein
MLHLAVAEDGHTPPQRTRRCWQKSEGQGTDSFQAAVLVLVIEDFDNYFGLLQRPQHHVCPADGVFGNFFQVVRH